MGEPTEGTLWVTGGISIANCNPSFVWSDDSRYLAASQFGLIWSWFHATRLLVIDTRERTVHATRRYRGWLQPRFFGKGSIETTHDPAGSASEKAWRIPEDLPTMRKLALDTLRPAGEPILYENAAPARDLDGLIDAIAARNLRGDFETFLGWMGRTTFHCPCRTRSPAEAGTDPTMTVQVIPVTLEGRPFIPLFTSASDPGLGATCFEATGLQAVRMALQRPDGCGLLIHARSGSYITADIRQMLWVLARYGSGSTVAERHLS